MNHNIKQMLKLIEDGEFLSKKAEMHRPNLEGIALFSSSSSSDSESVSFNSSNYSGIPITIDGEGFNEFPSLKKKNQEAEDDNADSLLEGRENGSYEELLGGIIEYEEKLRVSNLRLQLSEEEVKAEEVTTRVENLVEELRAMNNDA
ncbi:hypothetical protein Q3G72_008677 [Acer saccharum]|nr:hypothetical protein Q3G72_008677 [Acer saccharum]